MPKELTWQEAIHKVLLKSATPLHYTQITERIIADGLRKNIGATPAATVNAQITTSMKHRLDSPFARVGKGTYTLAAAVPLILLASSEVPTANGTDADDVEEQYAIVTSFGMFWRREAVDWTRNTKLLGMQQIGATSADFCQQRVIYLLYDGREVIYVGRTTDRALGTRLFEHTVDRLSASWDRFSWFGLIPVLSSGKLGDMPSQYDAAKLAPALEAILVEALEPRQNRKRGDDLAVVEYIQLEDPEIQKRKLKAAMDDLISKS